MIARPKSPTRSLLFAMTIASLAGCATPPPPQWIQTQLFFGFTRPDGGKVTESEWQDFLDRSITPRFPDGLTVLRSAGQWKGRDGKIVAEPSAVVMVLHSREHTAEDDAKLDLIAKEYAERFHQEAVMRIDEPASVKFISP